MKSLAALAVCSATLVAGCMTGSLRLPGGGGSSSSPPSSSGSRSPAPRSSTAAGTPSGVPAWCAPAQGRLRGEARRALAPEKDAVDSFRELVEASCDDGELGQAAQLAAAREAWSKRLGMTESDWGDAVEWAVNRTSQPASFFLEDKTKTWSTLSPVEQYALIYGSELDDLYRADALGSKLTEVGRLALIHRCLRSPKPVDWALCQADMTFDRTRAFAELRSSTAAEGWQRMAIRLDIDVLDKRFAKRAQQVKDLLAKSPEIEQLFTAAAEGRRTWTKASPALAELAFAIDDVRVRRARTADASCLAKTWPALKSAVSALPASRFANLEPSSFAAVVLSEPDSYLAALAHFNCAAAAGKHDLLTEYLGKALRSWPGFRGPRTAALTAILRTGFKLSFRDVHEVDYRWMHVSPNSAKGGTGEVDHVEPAGETARVVFTKQLVAQDECTNWKTGNRIVEIRDGKLIYEQSCTSWRKRIVDMAPEPQVVDARYVEGLRAKMLVDIRGGIVIAAWPKAGVKQPAIVLGIVVK